MKVREDGPEGLLTAGDLVFDIRTVFVAQPLWVGSQLLEPSRPIAGSPSRPDRFELLAAEPDKLWIQLRSGTEPADGATYTKKT